MNSSSEIVGQVNTIALGIPLIMGIVNITPDSFSGDGLFDSDQIIALIEKQIEYGATLVDLGAESSKPYSVPISEEEEIQRLIPIVKRVRAKFPKLFISVDTYKPNTAKLALDCGVDMINDIRGLTNPKMINVISEYNAAVTIMHMQGNPNTMQIAPIYRTDVTSEIINFLSIQTLEAQKNGIARNKIAIDPGIGFGKTLQHNLEILFNLEKFKNQLKLPVLIGTSRKGFIGKILDIDDPLLRVNGTEATISWSIMHGVDIVRVHDVKEASETIRVLTAIKSAQVNR